MLPRKELGREVWSPILGAGQEMGGVCSSRVFFPLNPHPTALSTLYSVTTPHSGAWDKAGALLTPFCAPLLGPRTPSGGLGSSPVSTPCIPTQPLLRAAPVPKLGHVLGHWGGSAPPRCPPALLLFLTPALTKAAERAESTRSHGLGRLWEPRLQAIDPSVQVCPGLLSPAWGGAGLAGHRCPCPGAQSPSELPCGAQSWGIRDIGGCTTGGAGSKTSTACPVPSLQIRIKRPQVRAPSQPALQP